jgi:pimeloyl-ACP methyl ester carboxylesterase
VGNRLPEGRFLPMAESFSGPIAIRLAAKLPARLVGLVPCATFASPPHAWLNRLRGLLELPLPIPPAGVIDHFTMGRWSTPGWKQRIRVVVESLRPT